MTEPKHLTAEQRQKIFNFFANVCEYNLMEDELNTLEKIIYPKQYPYVLTDDKQTDNKAVATAILKLFELERHEEYESQTLMYDSFHSEIVKLLNEATAEMQRELEQAKKNNRTGQRTTDALCDKCLSRFGFSN